MLSFFNRAARAEARAEALAAKLDDLTAKVRNIVSHATGGALHEHEAASWPLNSICVEISRHRNEVFLAGRMADMTQSERHVLDVLNCDWAFPASRIADDTGVSEKAVKAILRAMHVRGLVTLSPLLDEDRGTFKGRGYTLTTPGFTLQQEARRQ